MSPLAPQHVVFIPDGNRRWAKREGLSALEGHRQGMDRGRELLHRAIDLGIPYASFWGMSIDNFTKRSKIEVAGLVTIFQKLFEDFLDDEDLVKKEVRVRVLGRWAEKFPASAANVIKELEEKQSITPLLTSLFYWLITGRMKCCRLCRLLPKKLQRPGKRKP